MRGHGERKALSEREDPKGMPGNAVMRKHGMWTLANCTRIRVRN